ncbi:MAG: lactate utilization protein C [Hyphomicrobiaceae bacterium]
MSGASSEHNQNRRAAMLDKIRTGISDGGTVAVRRPAVEARLKAQPPHLIPERAKRDTAGAKAQLTEFLKGQTATVLDLKSSAEVPSAIAAYLRNINLPLRLRTGDDPRLAALPWSKEPALSLDRGQAQPGDHVSLTHAVAAVAETGTLVLQSGADNPVTLNFLPENHIVVVRAKDIVGAYEAAFDAVRQRLGKGTMPRTLNLISGPSRTADIGGRLVVGAHGPRRLCVVIVND